MKNQNSLSRHLRRAWSRSVSLKHLIGPRRIACTVDSSSTVLQSMTERSLVGGGCADADG
eukprot:3743841-Pleurochrysis_carterae.AAC.1